MSFSDFYENNLTVPGVMGAFNQPNPADSAMPYLDQAQNQLPGYFSPYMNAGNAALPQLQQQYGQLLGGGQSLQNHYNQMTNDPSAVMNGIGSHFQQSPGYQFQTQQAMGAANRAAAAGGMLGTPAEQQSIAGTVNGMANQDYYNYLNHGMSMYSQGLQGQQQMYGMGLNGMNDMAHMGYGASANLGEDLSQALQNKANLAYAGQADQNQAKNGMMGSMMGMVGGLL